MSEKKTHFRKMFNPDYIGAYALEPGQDLIVTIKSVNVETITNSDGRKEDAPVMRFQENVKPMILNSTNSKTIRKVHKSPYLEDWVGKKIQLYATTVKAFGEVVEALRIREYAPKVKLNVTLDCEECKGKISAYNGISAEMISSSSKKKYGKHLCVECGQKLKQQEESKDVD